MNLKVGNTFHLDNVTTASGHKLFKGGTVKLVHIFPRSSPPDPDLVAEYYGYEDRKSKAFEGVAMAFKEDRLVLDRIEPAGKRIILLSRYQVFLKSTAARQKEERTEFTSPATVIEELSVGQIFSGALGMNGQARFQVVNIGHSGDVRTTVRLAYETKLRSGEIIWPEGHEIPIDAFANNVVNNKLVRMS